MISGLNGFGPHYLPREENEFFQKKQICSVESVNREKSLIHSQQIPEQISRVSEADIKKLMSQTNFTEAEAKEVLEDREFYIELAMKQGLSRQAAEEQVDSVY
ncbi:hypothetical protein [Candidatus Protochlamydia amoebophila]|uniref:Uncharacterized protein n=1 Tax=Candidatus Protochlamydia amoebophila TaxID=362787 RepID=A0A0C1H1T5_9BACT|nr:hypothetical protein [Candidatus Protochlamydia amoebophila]KIC71644.1 hypothetical protein DB44_DG00030 [Candidatus Protochlamydia amoebophila]